MCLRTIYSIFFIAAFSILTINAQENYEVRQIKFKGNKTLDEDYLLESMALKEVSYIEKLIFKKEPFLFNRELIDLDMIRLQRIYQSEGFIAVESAIDSLIINEKKKKIKIRIEVEEGQPVLVDSVGISYAEEKPDINIDSLHQKIFKYLELKKGARFIDKEINNDVQIIQDAYMNMGYAYVKVDYDLNLRPEKFETDIFYIVKPGPVCYVGATIIEGNKNVSDKLIQKQIKYKEGQVYDKSKLSDTRENLYYLQLFRVVSVLPQKNDTARNSIIPVKIYIEEAPRLSARFGAGYGTEDKLRGFLDLNYRGVFSSASRLNLYAKHSSLEPYMVSLRWIQPQLFATKTTLTLNPYIGRKSEPGYDTRTFGINVPVSYRFNSNLISTVSYYLENVKQTLEEGDQELLDRNSDKFPYNKSGILTSAVFNSSDPKFSPDHGMQVSLGLKLNGYLFGGNFSYTRLWADVRNYQKVGSVVLALRGMVGGIKSADSDAFIPVEDRFYSGGSNSIRGWARARLGPTRESGTPIGGNSIVEVNVEARYHLFWRLSTVLFVEAGNVWTDSYRYELGNLNYAAGTGLRVDTPIGPVRFDVGFPVWNQKRSAQFFISVGQAF